jgi:hypothetical protein
MREVLGHAAKELPCIRDLNCQYIGLRNKCDRCDDARVCAGRSKEGAAATDAAVEIGCTCVGRCYAHHAPEGHHLASNAAWRALKLQRSVRPPQLRPTPKYRCVPLVGVCTRVRG